MLFFWHEQVRAYNAHRSFLNWKWYYLKAMVGAGEGISPPDEFVGGSFVERALHLEIRSSGGVWDSDQEGG